MLTRLLMLVPGGMIVLAIACTPNKAKTTASKTPVIHVVQKDVSLEHLYVSDIRAVQNVEVRSRVAGFLEKIYVDEGQHVSKGQLLFRIADEEYNADVAKAKAVLHNMLAEANTAEVECKRIKALVDKKIVSNVELELANAKLKSANAKIEEARSYLRSAEIKLSYTYIKAPFDGMIDRIQLKAGSLLDQGTLITTISDITSVYAYFNVSENDYLDFLKSKTGDDELDCDTARLVLADGKEYEYCGNVETVVSEFQENTGSIAFRVRFPNPKQLLRHKATGKIKLVSTVRKALMLPQKSVFEIQDKNYVFVLDSSNKVAMKNIKPLARLNGFYLLGSGISTHDNIVYEGIQNIKDGMRLDPVLVTVDTTTVSKTL